MGYDLLGFSIGLRLKYPTQQSFLAIVGRLYGFFQGGTESQKDCLLKHWHKMADHNHRQQQRQIYLLAHNNNCGRNKSEHFH